MATRPLDPRPDLLSSAILAGACAREPLLLAMICAHIEARVRLGEPDACAACMASAVDMGHDAVWFRVALGMAVHAGRLADAGPPC